MSEHDVGDETGAYAMAVRDAVDRGRDRERHRHHAAPDPEDESENEFDDNPEPEDDPEADADDMHPAPSTPPAQHAPSTPVGAGLVYPACPEERREP